MKFHESLNRETEQGQFFSGNDHRIYLLGNPVIWWGNIVFLGLFAATFLWNLVLSQRGHVDSAPVAERKGKSLYAGLWLLVGWALHYIPFWAMGRVLYFHHYFPACLYSSMITAVIIDYTLCSVMSYLPDKASSVVFHAFFGVFISILAYRYLFKLCVCLISLFHS